MVYQGEFLEIVGASGTGKTTLFHLINGILCPQEGEILFEGQNINHNKKIYDYRRNDLGYIFQDFKLLENLSVYDNIRLPLEIAKKEYGKESIMQLAKKLEIDNLIDAKCRNLSGGEKQRVAVARALVHHPKLLLADEPSGNLDFESRDEMMKILKDYHQSGLTIIMVTHDLELRKYASRIMEMEQIFQTST